MTVIVLNFLKWLYQKDINTFLITVEHFTIACDVNV